MKKTSSHDIMARSNAFVERGNPIFPPEIFQLIIDYLEEDFATLKLCCLVSRAFRGLSRPRLFRHITLHSDTLAGTRLADAFLTSPNIPTLVRSLDIVHIGCELLFNPIIPQLLGSIAIASAITTLRLTAFMEWRALTDDFEKNLLLLLGQPSLHTVDLI
jgi:hypothetical protein